MTTLSTDHMIPTSLNAVDLSMDRTLMSTEMPESITNAAEWRRLRPRINNPDDREVSARSPNPRNGNLSGHQHVHLISRIKEVEENLRVCKQKLDQYIDAACCRDEENITEDFIRKLESISSEVINLRKTVPVSPYIIIKNKNNRRKYTRNYIFLLTENEVMRSWNLLKNLVPPSLQSSHF